MTVQERAPLELQQAAKDHLWLHFTRMGGYAEADVPIIVRGDGCYLEDANGKRYLDALAGLFSVNIGYGYGEEIGEAAAAQMRELPFYTNWSYAHPRAIELAAEVASLTPGDLNRVFFVSGGSEAVESAWKLARQYYAALGDHERTKFAQIPGDRVGETPMPRTTRRWKRFVLRTWITSGTSGSNGVRSAVTPLIDSAPIVVPWYASRRDTTFHRRSPRAAWYCRASFHALSTASDPPETKKTRLRSPGASDATSAASSIARGCAYDQFV